MNIRKKKIGIWGFGLVGKSAVNFLSNKVMRLQLLNKNQLTKKDILLLKNKNVDILLEKNINSFFKNNNLILPSPGIDLRPYIHYKDKWLSELDLFFNFFNKKIIGITGTVGKTSITTLLTDILNFNNLKALACGNIGLPVLDVLNKQNSIEYAVLEASSFQLETAKSFAPDLAVLTNFFPNHLDRYNHIDDYFQAKKNIFINQNQNQIALLPINLLNKMKNTNSLKNYFSLQKPDFSNIPIESSVFYIDDHKIKVFKNNEIITIKNIPELPQNTFLINWLIIYATMYLLNIKKIKIPKKPRLLEHRLEKVDSINGVDYYNDSKSTVPASTLAALEKLKDPIILIIGGLSKGINRSAFIEKLNKRVKRIYFFGREAKKLSSFCDIENKIFINLEDLLNNCIKDAKSGDKVLFSPAGASFDEFKNYEERGRIFKKLLKKLKNVY